MSSEPVEIKPFSLTFDAEDGYMDFRPKYGEEVVGPKEKPIVDASSEEVPPEQDKLPETPEPPAVHPKTPEAEPPVTRRAVKDIIIPSAH